MEIYPPEFVRKLIEVVDIYAKWIEAQFEQNATKADGCVKRADAMKKKLLDLCVVNPASCHQLLDVVASSAAVTLCKFCNFEHHEEYQADYDAASGPRPEAIKENLWKWTLQFCLASARKTVAEHRNMPHLGKLAGRAYELNLKRMEGKMNAELSKWNPQRIAECTGRVICGSVFVLAAGECTTTFVQAAEKQNSTWLDVLRTVHENARNKSSPSTMLSTKLWSNEAFDLERPFRFQHLRATRALLVGVDHTRTGTGVSVKRDVQNMQQHLQDRGFDTKVLLNFSIQERPTKPAIISGMKWLTESAEAGDSLVFHFVALGGSVWSDEGDGEDDAFFPADYEKHGVIGEDDIFEHLISPLNAGVRLTCVIDHGHRVVPINLPYAWVGRGHLSEHTSGQMTAMTPDPNFHSSDTWELVKDRLHY